MDLIVKMLENDKVNELAEIPEEIDPNQLLNDTDNILQSLRAADGESETNKNSGSNKK